MPWSANIFIQDLTLYVKTNKHTVSYKIIGIPRYAKGLL